MKKYNLSDPEFYDESGNFKVVFKSKYINIKSRQYISTNIIKPLINESKICNKIIQVVRVS